MGAVYEQAWQTYINFELRYKELDKARKIFERFLLVYPLVKNWIKYAHFEASHGYINRARNAYERAVSYFGDDNIDERLFIAFAKFEEGQQEVTYFNVIFMLKYDGIQLKLFKLL